MFRLLEIPNHFYGLELCLGRKKRKMTKDSLSKKTPEKSQDNKASSLSATTLTGKPSETTTPKGGKSTPQESTDEEDRAAHAFHVRQQRRHLFRGKKNQDFRTYSVFHDEEEGDVTDPHRRRRVEEAQESEDRDLGPGIFDAVDVVNGGGPSDSPWDNIQFGKFGKQDDEALSKQKAETTWSKPAADSKEDLWTKNAW